MYSKVDIGIIGAMDPEVEILLSSLAEREQVEIGSVTFYLGTIYSKRVVIARCGIGKVFAAICAQTMILNFAPELIVNTGVGGGLARDIKVTDIVVATSLVQHDMDTSAIGDPKGLVSGINKIFFDADKAAADIVADAARRLGFTVHSGIIASGDKFIADKADKERISSDFGAAVCEMEGAAIAHVAFVNGTRFAVIRAVSDSADDGSSMDYMQFLPIAAERSSAITLALIEAFN